MTACLLSRLWRSSFARRSDWTRRTTWLACGRMAYPYQYFGIRASTQVRARPEPTSEITMKHAPLWSWASILGAISCVEISDLLATTEFLDVQTTRISPDFSDGTDSCRIRVRGPVCKSRRCVRDGAPCICVAQHTEFQEFGDFEFQMGNAIIIEWDTSGVAVANWLKIIDSWPATSTCFLLHIASESSVDGPMERGFVLRRTTVGGTYSVWFFLHSSPK